MFVTVNGGAEQEIYAELGYKWVVWNHSDTTVDLQAGKNTITIAAKSLDGTKQTVGTAIIDKIDLTQPNPGYTPIYEAENAVLHGAAAAYDKAGVSGSGYVPVASGESVTFWVYNADDSEKSLEVKTLGGGAATLRVNGVDLGTVSDTAVIPAFLVGGINKVEVVGSSGTLALDRVAVQASKNELASQSIEAEAGTLAGSAKVQDLSLASGGKAVVGIGGAPGNGNTLTQKVTVAQAGTYAMTLRYSNEEQSPSSHYNPDPVARRADITVNGGPVQKVLFPQSYNANQFWDLTVEVQLQAGENSIRFASEEQPDFNGVTYISERYPTLGLRSQWAPNLDRMTFTALHPDTASAPTLSAGVSSVAQGGTVTASGTGFTPGEKVEFVLHSDPIVLGEASADAAGAVSATLTVPVSAPVGDHRLIATGGDLAALGDHVSRGDRRERRRLGWGRNGWYRLRWDRWRGVVGGSGALGRRRLGLRIARHDGLHLRRLRRSARRGCGSRRGCRAHRPPKGTCEQLTARSQDAPGTRAPGRPRVVRGRPQR
ncbi:hypothetical protein QE454_000786 [Microbacterium sp. SORGH_AS454]|nr:CBM35 domain-containing protein [Microbacterium sp. SORGH_AS_0454]MDR6097167.1 hypothetical protein [Microbacterium sp. SORGH_AS_0454]